jgi:hypothetical protein
MRLVMSTMRIIKREKRNLFFFIDYIPLLRVSRPVRQHVRRMTSALCCIYLWPRSLTSVFFIPRSPIVATLSVLGAVIASCILLFDKRNCTRDQFHMLIFISRRKKLLYSLPVTFLFIRRSDYNSLDSTRRKVKF